MNRVALRICWCVIGPWGIFFIWNRALWYVCASIWLMIGVIDVPSGLRMFDARKHTCIHIERTAIMAMSTLKLAIPARGRKLDHPLQVRPFVAVLAHSICAFVGWEASTS